MPHSEPIINIRGFKVISSSGFNPVMLEVVFEDQVVCPHCQGIRVRKKEKFRRLVRHESLGLRKTFLLIHAHKFLCRECGRYFNQRFPGILPYRRATEHFREEVFRKHHQGICQRTLSTDLGVGSATIERWYQDFLKRTTNEFSNAHSPKVLGIDEHFFTRKKGYATTLCDLTRQKVYDVVLGRTESSLGAYLRRLPNKENTKVVVMDLSDNYRRIVKNHYPKAMIVADRFHVVRLVNHSFLKTWADLHPEGRNHRGLLSLMRRHWWRLKPEQQITLKNYLNQVPGLEPIYQFKQSLVHLLVTKHQTKKQCRFLIPRLLRFIEELKVSGFTHLERLGRTLQAWNEEIARMWRFTKTNSITEGLHNKMEMISRRAYGFRNFENYRLRVKALCG